MRNGPPFRQRIIGYLPSYGYSVAQSSSIRSSLYYNPAQTVNLTPADFLRSVP